MRKTLFKRGIYLMIISMVSACQDEIPQQATLGQSFDYVEQKVEYLNFNIEELTPRDAGVVAQLCGKQQGMSRSCARKNITNIVPINGKDGTPAIYAVNYDDGYILISATTEYYPILAEVDHGTFSLDELGQTGQSVVVSGMIESISQGLSGDELEVCKSMWAKYKEDSTNDIRVKSRGYDDINTALDALESKYDMVY